MREIRDFMSKDEYEIVFISVTSTDCSIQRGNILENNKWRLMLRSANREGAPGLNRG